MASAVRGAANPDKTNRRMLLGAVAFAGIAAILAFVALSNFSGDDDGASFGASLNVVTASQDISPGTKITEDMLELTTIPQNAAISGAITDEASLVGLTARREMVKGEQVSAIKIVESPRNRDELRPADAVPAGKRAVAVDVDENTNVGGLVVAGDRVDVIVVYSKETEERATDVSNVILQDVEVLSVAQNVLEPISRIDSEGIRSRARTPTEASRRRRTTPTRRRGRAR
jgi:pilus assembly protein CpaB